MVCNIVEAVVVAEAQIMALVAVAEEEVLPQANTADKLLAVWMGPPIVVAAQALEVGLVDEQGYWREAVSAMATLLEEPGIKVLRYEESFSWSSFLRVTAEWPQVLRAAIRPSETFRMKFLFAP